MSLKQRLVRYFKAHPTLWVPKEQIADLARASELKATHENTYRRLRELEEEGILENKKEDGYTLYHLKPQLTLEQRRLASIQFFEAYQPLLDQSHV